MQRIGMTGSIRRRIAQRSPLLTREYPVN